MLLADKLLSPMMVVLFKAAASLIAQTAGTGAGDVVCAGGSIGDAGGALVSTLYDDSGIGTLNNDFLCCALANTNSGDGLVIGCVSGGGVINLLAGSSASSSHELLGVPGLFPQRYC